MLNEGTDLRNTKGDTDTLMLRKDKFNYLIKHLNKAKKWDDVKNKGGYWDIGKSVYIFQDAYKNKNFPVDKMYKSMKKSIKEATDRKNTYSKQNCGGSVGGNYDCRVNGTWGQITVKGWDRNKYGHKIENAKQFCDNSDDCVAIASSHVNWNWPVHTISKFKPCNGKGCDPKMNYHIKNVMPEYYKVTGSGLCEKTEHIVPKDECKQAASALGFKPKRFSLNNKREHAQSGCFMDGNTLFHFDNKWKGDNYKKASKYGGRRYICRKYKYNKFLLKKSGKPKLNVSEDECKYYAKNTLGKKWHSKNSWKSKPKGCIEHPNTRRVFYNINNNNDNCNHGGHACIEKEDEYEYVNSGAVDLSRALTKEECYKWAKDKGITNVGVNTNNSGPGCVTNSSKSYMRYNPKKKLDRLCGTSGESCIYKKTKK